MRQLLITEADMRVVHVLGGGIKHPNNYKITLSISIKQY